MLFTCWQRVHALATVACCVWSAESCEDCLSDVPVLQVGVVGSGQGMTDYKKVARHDFNPDAE